MHVLTFSVPVVVFMSVSKDFWDYCDVQADGGESKSVCLVKVCFS